MNGGSRGGNLAFPEAATDVRERAALERLSASLSRLGWPALRAAREDGDGGPAVVFLACPSIYKLAIAREGGRQAPGDVLLALDASWLQRTQDAEGRAELRLLRGVRVDAGGAATLVDYAAPRRVRYFANFMTPGCSDREDGLALERGLQAPMSSSAQLEKLTNDKLLTRLLLAESGIGVPATLALLMPEHPLRRGDPSAPRVRVISLPQARAAIRAEIERFLRERGGGELVVKPSGPHFHSGRGVKLFGAGDLDAAAEHALALAADERMESDGAVLVDERVAPPALLFRAGPAEAEGPFGFLQGRRVAIVPLSGPLAGAARPCDKKDWNFRVLAARAGDGKGEAAGVFVRAGSWGLPTTAEAAHPDDDAAMITFEQLASLLREQHGLLRGAGEAAALRARLDGIAREAFAALAAHEARRARAAGEPPRAQTDFIGLDVMARVSDGRLELLVIEVNDHDAGGQAQLDEFYPDQAGEHSRRWLATALARARRDAEERP